MSAESLPLFFVVDEKISAVLFDSLAEEIRLLVIVQLRVFKRRDLRACVC